MKSMMTVSPQSAQILGPEIRKKYLMNTAMRLGSIALAFISIVSTVSAQQTFVQPTDRDTAAGTGAAVVLIIFFILLSTAMMLVPGVIATMRKHHNALAIWMIAIFAGWTGVGWIIALVWACTNPTPIAPPNPVVVVNR
jgi:Superinfection immunity protein